MTKTLRLPLDRVNENEIDNNEKLTIFQLQNRRLFSLTFLLRAASDGGTCASGCVCRRGSTTNTGQCLRTLCRCSAHRRSASNRTLRKLCDRASFLSPERSKIPILNKRAYTLLEHHRTKTTSQRMEARLSVQRLTARAAVKDTKVERASTAVVGRRSIIPNDNNVPGALERANSPQMPFASILVLPLPIRPANDARPDEALHWRAPMTSDLLQTSTNVSLFPLPSFAVRIEDLQSARLDESTRPCRVVMTCCPFSASHSTPVCTHLHVRPSLENPTTSSASSEQDRHHDSEQERSEAEKILRQINRFSLEAQTPSVLTDQLARPLLISRSGALQQLSLFLPLPAEEQFWVPAFAAVCLLPMLPRRRLSVFGFMEFGREASQLAKAGQRNDSS